MHQVPFSSSRRGGGAFPPRNSSAVILDIIRQNPRISRKELAHISGFSPALVTKLCADLLRRNLIREVGIGHSSGGRRPIYIELNHEAFSVVCVHTCGGVSSLAVCDCCGNVREYRRMSEGDPVLTPEALERVGEQIRREGIDWLALGLAVEDLLYEESLAERFHRYFAGAGYPVLVQRASFAALWGMNKYIYHERYQNCCYLHLGPSIYGAVLSNGQPLLGASGLLGCGWRQLPAVRSLEETLRGTREISCSAICSRVLRLSGMLRLLFDVDLVVLDLSDPTLPLRLADRLQAMSLEEEGYDLDTLPYPSLFHRGVASMLSNLIGWSSREDWI